MPSVDTNLKSSVDRPSRFDFNAKAGIYDQWYKTAEGVMYDHLEKKAVVRYLPQNAQGMKLLEVGCGTGHWSEFLSEYGFEVTGLDVSKPMIKIAQSKNIPNALFQIAGGHSLPCQEAPFRQQEASAGKDGRVLFGHPIDAARRRCLGTVFVDRLC